jgi:hypothetical protein
VAPPQEETEANVLLSRRYDAEAGIPDYNAFVRMERS